MPEASEAVQLANFTRLKKSFMQLSATRCSNLPSHCEYNRFYSSFIQLLHRAGEQIKLRKLTESHVTPRQA